VLSVTNY